MPTNEKSQMVGFRLHSNHLAKLKKLAEVRGVSHHEQARNMLIDALENHTQEAIKDDVLAIREKFSLFTGQFYEAIEMLLFASGLEEKEAKELVDKILRNRAKNIVP